MKPGTHLAFDLDGTLFDVSAVAVRAFELGITAFIEEKKTAGIRVPSHAEIIAVLGVPTDEIFGRLFPDLSTSEQSRMNDLCTGAFVGLIRSGGGELFPGVKKTLHDLYSSGRKILVASNGRPEYIEAVLDHHGIIEYFSRPFVCLGRGITDKSHIVAEYMKSVGHAGLLIMIGDRKSDLDAAASNGVPFIGCAFGHAGAEEILGTRWTVTSFPEIKAAVEAVERSHQ